jgi:SAM-dependent methyltransferase
MARAGFDRLAGIYPTLEYLAFGRDLEATRWSLLDRLADCRSILIVGEGDGRTLARLVRLAPQAAIDCREASAAMIARARGRLTPADQARVRFRQVDAVRCPYPAAAFDAVVTLFFLDCFSADTAAALVGRIARSLRPGGVWLFADFAEPAGGWARWRARMWLALLYAFFRWQTDLEARRLPPSEALIAAAGLRPIETREFQAGLLRTVLFRALRPTAD